MAATNKTPTVSIKISAISKPAIVRAFAMVPPSRLYATIDQTRSDHVEVVIERIREDAAPTVLQTYEMQRPKICARAGSATRLNAGSHPTGGCALTATGNETAEVRFSGNRSPLAVRLTEMVCCAVLAAPGVLTTAGNAPAIRPTAIAAAIKPLSFPVISASPLWRRVGLSGQVVPLHVGQFQQ
jgi:hypothetical protein